MLCRELYRDVAQNRVRLTDTLLAFVKTDTTLFVFDEECKQFFTPVVAAANKILNTSFVLTNGLDIVECNLGQDNEVRCYLNKLSLQKFTLLYLTAVEVRSVLLGVLFVEHEIDVDTLLEVAFFEDKYQQRKWGVVDEAVCRYREIKSKLVELEGLSNENCLYED